MSILTAGDSVNGYRMAGWPDGLGAYDNGDGTFTLLMNHELSEGHRRRARARRAAAPSSRSGPSASDDLPSSTAKT